MKIGKTFLVFESTEFPFQKRVYIFNIMLSIHNIDTVIHTVEDVAQIISLMTHLIFSQFLLGCVGIDGNYFP